MPFTHTKSHRDANHAEIVKYYEQLGCTVVDTSGVGMGFPDAVIGCVGFNDLIEIKTEEGGLELKQQRFIRDWRGSVRIIRTMSDVVAHVTLMRARVRQ